MELQIPENMPVGDIPTRVLNRESTATTKAINTKAINTKANNTKGNKVHFDESTIVPQQVIKPSISGVKAKMVRPHIPEPKPKISYDDILAKMGMFVADGELHLLDGKPQKQVQQIKKMAANTNTNANTNAVKQVQLAKPIPTTVASEQNSYIYNKYFKNEASSNPNVRTPQTLQEYRDMLIHDIIQKQKVKQIKSTKLIMPTSNINFAQGGYGNLNRLFSFSQR